MNFKNQRNSISQKLKNISVKRNTRYSLIETEFLIERLLARIVSVQKLNETLIFKGGYVGLRVYNSPRYTIDLDALLTKANLRETLDLIKEVSAQDIGDCVWFGFEREIDLLTQGEYGGIRLVFRAAIGERLMDISKSQIIHFDLGIGDPVTPGPIQQKTPELLGNSILSWQVYPIETILAEKLHALITRGETSSRSKDIFDICQFLPNADGKILKNALKASFDYRKTKLPDDIMKEISAIDLSLLKKGWTNAVVGIENTPSCEEAVELIIAILSTLQIKQGQI